MLVCDYRGLGDSPPPFPTSIRELVADVVAVADASGSQSLALFSGGLHASVMLEVALAYPDRIAGVVLTEPVLTYAEYAPKGITDPLLELAQRDWRRYARANASFWNHPEEDRAAMEEVTVETGSPEMRAAFHAIERTIEAPEELKSLAVPVLVLQSAQNIGIAADFSRKAAAAIPGARLARVEPSVTRFSAMVEPTLAFLRDFEPFGASPAAAPSAEEAPSDARLSPRELEVLRLVAEGRTNAQIAETLVIAPNTVARHVQSILAKTGAANRAEAAVYASRHGFLE